MALIVYSHSKSNRAHSADIAAHCAASVAPGLIAHPIESSVYSHQIRLPSDAAIYGVTISGTGMRHLSYSTVAFKSGHCSFFMGADGASGINITGGSFRHMFETFSPGGSAITSAFACAYIPQVMAAASGSCGVSTSQKELITPISTHMAGLYFTAVLVPPHTSDDMITPSQSPITTYAIVAAHIEEVDHRPTVVGSEDITCALPLNEEDICSASLSYFVASFAGQHRTPSRILAQIIGEIRSFVTRQA